MKVTKGRATEYDEKKKQVSITLTPFAIASLNEKMNELRYRNLSQLVEKWARGEL